MSRVGDYELLEQIGSGSSGTVYRARDPRGREVALKLLKPPASPKKYDAWLTRFRREARTASRISHPGVVRVLDISEQPPFLAFELVRGPSLRQELRRRGTLRPDEALALVEKLARAVHAAHEQGVIHRDLKPENILLDGSEPRIIDLGLSKDLTEEGEGAALTRSGTLVGTPHYCAPEQARGEVKDLDRRCDVWSLGVILYECLTGTTPFDAPNMLGVIEKVVERDPERPPDLAPEASRAFEVALRALEKDRERRPATALAYAVACASARRSSPARSVRMTLIGLVVFLALVNVGLFVMPRPAPPLGPAPVEGALALCSLGEEKLVRGELEASVACFDSAVALDGSLARAFAGRSRARSLRHDADGAIRDGGRAIALDPAIAPVLTQALATAFLERALAREATDRKGALSDLEAALARDPASPRALAHKAALLGVDDLETVIACATRAIDGDRALALAWTVRAEARTLSGDHKGAISDATEAIRLAPDDPAPLVCRACALMAVFEYARCVPDLDRAIALSPANDQHLLERAVTRLSSGDVAGCLDDYEIVLDRGPFSLERPVVKRMIWKLRHPGE